MLTEVSVCTLLTFRAELCFHGWHWLDSSWQTCCNFFYKQRVIELVVSRYFSSIMSGSKFIQFFTIGGLIGRTVFEEFRQNKILWLIFLLTSTFWCHFKNYINICLIKLVILAILSVCCSVIKRHAYCCTTITLSISEHFRLPQINLCSKHLTPQPLCGHGKKICLTFSHLKPNPLSPICHMTDTQLLVNEGMDEWLRQKFELQIRTPSQSSGSQLVWDQ